MTLKRYRMFWLCSLLIAVFAGCDSTNSNDTSNYQLTVAASPASLLTGEFSTVTATLTNVSTTTDSSGTSSTSTNPVAGYAVAFSATQNNSGGTLTVVNNITDASGNATAIYQAGSAAGVDIVQAGIDSGQTSSVSISVTLQ